MDLQQNNNVQCNDIADQLTKYCNDRQRCKIVHVNQSDTLTA